MAQPLISIVLGSYNRQPFLRRTLESVRQELVDFAHEIIVIDGGSDDGSLRWLSAQKDVVTIIQHNRGDWRGKPLERRSWGYFMNLGFKCAQGKYICMLSDDCLVIPGAIRHGYAEFEQLLTEGKNIGALAFYWRNWPEYARYFVMRAGAQIFVNHGIYLKAALEAVNYLDETHYLFYCADADLCFRLARAGYLTVATDRSLIEHYSHANMPSRKSNKPVGERDFAQFKARWGEWLEHHAADEIFSFLESAQVPDDQVASEGFGAYHRKLMRKKSFKQKLRPFRSAWRHLRGTAVAALKQVLVKR